MWKIFLIATVPFLFTDGLAQTFQTYNIDSLKLVLRTELHDTNRIWALNNLGRNIPNSDTIITLAEEAIALSRKIGFKKGEAEAYNNIGYWFNQQGNYPKALRSYLHSIQLSESVNFEAGLKRSFNSISTIYIYLKDYSAAIGYSEKARRLSIKLKDFQTLALATSWLSKAYLELHRTDSALRYAQLSYEIASRLNEPFSLYFATARLGEINAATGNYSLALEYLRMSLNFSKKDGRYFRISGVHQQLAMVFKSTGMRDSCLWHAQEAFLISKQQNLYGTLLSSSLLLSELYEGRNDSESLRYHKFALTAKDSLFSQEKNRQIADLSFNETLRQQELEAEKRQAAEDRKNNLQYAAIALGFVLFVILFLLLSHTIMANQTIIKFLGTLALLIVFEFMNLLLDPFIGSLSNNSPLLMLTIMVCIAALLIPVHQKLEKWITHKLVEKNNKIRLAAAKKTIATLEGTTNND